MNLIIHLFYLFFYPFHFFDSGFNVSILSGIADYTGNETIPAILLLFGISICDEFVLLRARYLMDWV
jgi:hypothetical protein